MLACWDAVACSQLEERVDKVDVYMCVCVCVWCVQTHRGSQAQETYASVCRSIWRQQGMRGFYAGIIPEYLKVG